VNEHVDKLPDSRTPRLPNVVVQYCAHKVGGVYDARVESCVGHGLGRALLRHSMQEAMQADFDVSCTVALNGHKRAVRDDGRWKETIPPDGGGNSVDDYVSEICHLAGMDNCMLD